MKMFCYVIKNTKDSTLNLAPDNILNEQLIFSMHSPYFTNGEKKKNAKMAIEYDSEKIANDKSVINLWKAAFSDYIAEWQRIEDDKGNVWHGWIIKKRALKPC